MLYYSYHQSLQAKFSTDTMYPKEKSLFQNNCVQIYLTKFGLNACYPLTNATGDSIGSSLRDLTYDFGIPSHLTFDGASAKAGRNTLFMKTIRELDIQYHMSGPRRPNENPAELSIREIKRRWYSVMVQKKVPRRLWDFGLVWICETNNLSVSSSKYSKGRTALEMLTGETPDISEYTDFPFYDWVTYRGSAGLGEITIGKWLGVSHKIGQLMSFWILTPECKVISCTIV